MVSDCTDWKQSKFLLFWMKALDSCIFPYWDFWAFEIKVWNFVQKIECHSSLNSNGSLSGYKRNEVIVFLII